MLTFPVLIGACVLNISAVRVQSLPDRVVWKSADWLVLATLPFLFLLGWLVGVVTKDDPQTIGIVDTTARVVLLIVVIILYRKLLGEHWRAFRRAPWLSIGIVLSGLLVLWGVVKATEWLVATLNLRDVLVIDFFRAGSTGSGGNELWFFFFIMLSPLVTPLIEEFVFRHVLMMKLFVIHRAWFISIVVLGSSLLFASMHIVAAGGDVLGLLPYMTMGIVFALLYLWVRNIWHVFIVHVAWNFMVVVYPILALFFSMG